MVPDASPVEDREAGVDRDAVVARLMTLPLWGPMGIACGLRAGLRCEYCDRDLLSSLDDYKAWTQDHIVPQRFGGADTFENMAVACHPRNSAYRKAWDPRSVAGATASRAELVTATRRLIAEKRAAEQAVLTEVREVTGWSLAGSLEPSPSPAPGSAEASP